MVAEEVSAAALGSTLSLRVEAESTGRRRRCKAKPVDPRSELRSIVKAKVLLLSMNDASLNSDGTIDTMMALIMMMDELREGFSWCISGK